MTKRRINTIEEADAAMAQLGWLKAQGFPNDAVRRLHDCAVVYRAALSTLMIEGGEQKRPGFVDRVEQKRKG